MVESKEKYRIIVMAILLAGACFLTYYFHARLETGVLFTHFFYFPIILAALWWRRKGAAVAIFLAVLLILSHIFLRPEVVTANDYLRALTFIVIAFVVAELSERIAKSQDKTAHLNAILSAIRKINKLIIREKDRDRLIQGVCEKLIETRGYNSSWIALVDENCGFITAAEAGLGGESFFQLVEKMKRGEFTQCGQNALKQSCIMIVKDVATDCANCPLVGLYAGKVCMAIRLEHRDRIFGILSVSFPAETAAGADEQSLFNEVAGDIAFALHDMGLEEAHKRAERAVQEAREYAENILGTVREPLLVLDTDLRVISANRSFYRIFQVTPEETERKSLYDLGNRQLDIPALRELLEKLLPENTVFDDFEVEYDFETIGRRIMLLNARQIYDEANKIHMILLAIEDITERKRMEEELACKEKLATIGQLASGVGHELRNPLGVIGNSAYYLKMKLKDADEKVQKHVDILKREVNRANRIISDLLDFSRVRSPSLEEGNVNSIIKETLADIKVPENISLETQLNEELPIILVNPDQIRRVFLNIISNAVQAMPEGGRLDIKTGVKDDFAEIMLRDTGEGIPKEHLQKIFEPLFTKKAKGIGLGLTIVKSIVEGHKGKIEVESEVGEGTTFTIKLPLQRIEEKGS
jgi:PAS domain S-box-containing protein